jgi:hypothetical protein
MGNEREQWRKRLHRCFSFLDTAGMSEWPPKGADPESWADAGLIAEERDRAEAEAEQLRALLRQVREKLPSYLDEDGFLWMTDTYKLADLIDESHLLDEPSDG